MNIFVGLLCLVVILMATTGEKPRPYDPVLRAKRRIIERHERERWAQANPGRKPKN